MPDAEAGVTPRRSASAFVATAPSRLQGVDRLGVVFESTKRSQVE